VAIYAIGKRRVAAVWLDLCARRNDNSGDTRTFTQPAKALGAVTQPV